MAEQAGQQKSERTGATFQPESSISAHIEKKHQDKISQLGRTK
jgi:hypothetical protein